MKNNLELLEMYKDEKERAIGSVETRTGLEPFPTFQEWKAEYIPAYMATHKEVSVEEADALMDAAVEEAETILETKGAKDVETEIEDADVPTRKVLNPAKEGSVSLRKAKAIVEDVKPTVDLPTEVEDTEQVEQTTNSKTEPKVKKMTAKAKTTAPKAKKAAAKDSKSALGQKVFNKMHPQVLAGKKARKDVIEKLQSDANMSPAYAATFYQTMVKKATVSA